MEIVPSVVNMHRFGQWHQLITQHRTVTIVVQRWRGVKMREYIVQVIDDTPLSTEIKVVRELVRCKDCIHSDDSVDGMGFCYCDYDEGRAILPYGFCDAAKRRKERK